MLCTKNMTLFIQVRLWANLNCRSLLELLGIKRESAEERIAKDSFNNQLQFTPDRCTQTQLRRFDRCLCATQCEKVMRAKIHDNPGMSPNPTQASSPPPAFGEIVHLFMKCWFWLEGLYYWLVIKTWNCCFSFNSNCTNLMRMYTKWKWCLLTLVYCLGISGVNIFNEF